MNIDKTMKYITPISYSMIVARDKRAGIGLGNGLPWPKCKVDFDWFKRHTMGKLMVMGFKTWETMGSRPLPGRISCVLTTKQEYLQGKEYNKVDTGPFSGFVIFFQSISAFKRWLTVNVGTEFEVPAPKKQGETEFKSMTVTVMGEIMVIGGATVYQEFQNDINSIYLTTFEGNWEADTFLDIDLHGWEMRYHDSTSKLNPVFQIYTRQPIMVANHGWMPGHNTKGDDNVQDS